MNLGWGPSTLSLLKEGGPGKQATQPGSGIWRVARVAAAAIDAALRVRVREQVRGTHLSESLRDLGSEGAALAVGSGGARGIPRAGGIGSPPRAPFTASPRFQTTSRPLQ